MDLVFSSAGKITWIIQGAVFRDRPYKHSYKTTMKNRLWSSNGPPLLIVWIFVTYFISR